MEAIALLARDHDVSVIEDAAQAIGAEGAGSYGAMSSLSFYPSKNLSAMGEAGMVLTDDDTHAGVLRRLRNHGAEKSYVHDIIGGNFRMDAFQAAVLNVKLDHLDAWTSSRREKAKRYTELFRESGVVESGRITLPEDSSEHVYHQYVIRSAERDALKDRLAAEGVSSGIYYPLPLPLQPCFANLGYGPGDFPEAERAAKQTLALPIYPELTEEQQRSVVSILSR